MAVALTRTLSLTEYRRQPAVEIEPDELSALRTIAPSITIEPSLVVPGCYDLTPGSWIGAINLGGISIDIRPKIPIDRVLFLISYALDPYDWHDTPFDFAEDVSLFEAIIPGFVAMIRRAFARGILQGYRAEEASLATVRGRIRFDDQIRDRFGIFPPIEVRYDEFTEDIEENRVIKSAIERLGRLRIRSDAARRSLRAFDSALANVQIVEYAPHRLPDITYTRLNEHYRPAVELAKLILRSCSFDLDQGRVRASSFLVDMNEVFESFVYVALREALGLSERVFPQGAAGRSLYLDEAKRIRLEPDLSWWNGNTCRFVGDVKYKRVSVAGFLHPDLYQLLAYTIATNLHRGLLIYAAGEGEPVRHWIEQAGKVLEVISLDVSGTPAEILREIDRIATSITLQSRRYA